MGALAAASIVALGSIAVAGGDPRLDALNVVWDSAQC